MVDGGTVKTGVWGSGGGYTLMLVGVLGALGERSQSNGLLESGLLVGELGGECEGRGAGSAHREGTRVKHPKCVSKKRGGR